MSFRDVPFAFALLDLPFQEAQQHKYKSDGKRGINISAGSNLVIFKQEIKEGQVNLKNDLMITHRYRSLLENNNNKEIEDFIINHPYCCEIIMTNISPQRKDVILLQQIPNGSLPLMKTKFIQSQQYTLQPYTTQIRKIEFYFPKDGEFTHQSSNISENLVVTAKSAQKQLVVGKKRVIKKVETFRDLLITTKDDKEKKAKILDILENKFEMVRDKEFGFSLNDFAWLLYDDNLFFVQVATIYSKRMIASREPILVNMAMRKSSIEMMKDKKSREVILKLAQSFFAQNKYEFMRYVYQPLQSSFVSLSTHELFNNMNFHKEYFPMVNQRVFQIGGQAASTEDSKGHKEILNNQFRQTYCEFLHLLLHQEISAGGIINLNEKLKLQLTYFLQLQDRVDEAIEIFKTIDLQKLDSKAAQIQYDYMLAYFDFFLETNSDAEFANARRIVELYQDYPIEHYRVMFKKIKEQLDEIDAGRNAQKDVEMKIDELQLSESNAINPAGDQEATEEQKRLAQNKTKKKHPVIHEIVIDEAERTLKLESDNIHEITLKYYLIDAEILFSRSPFVKDQAEKFSYVKPFMTSTIGISESATTINLPNELKGKNLVIEIGSDDIQQFKTFYSSELKVQIIEDFGELKVYHRETNKPLPKVYVKVFCKDSSGERFFRDGFTDIRGKFEYANASGKSLSSIQKFAILVSHDDFGQVIKEVDKPKK